MSGLIFERLDPILRALQKKPPGPSRIEVLGRVAGELSSQAANGLWIGTRQPAVSHLPDASDCFGEFAKPFRCWRFRGNQIPQARPAAECKQATHVRAEAHASQRAVAEGDARSWVNRFGHPRSAP